MQMVLTPIFEMFLIALSLMTGGITEGSFDIVEDGKVEAVAEWTKTVTYEDEMHYYDRTVIKIKEKGRLTGTVTIDLVDNALYQVTMAGMDAETVDVAPMFMEMNWDNAAWYRQAVASSAGGAFILEPTEKELTITYTETGMGLLIPIEKIKGYEQ
jgi:hypothetical protein